MKLLKILLSSIAICVSACKPQLSFENAHQNEKSDILMSILTSYIDAEKVIVGWLPVITKNCLESPNKISQSDCINLILDVTGKSDSLLEMKKIKEQINAIDLKVYKKLVGTSISITAVVRKKGCESSPITPSSMNKCFKELHSQLIKMED